MRHVLTLCKVAVMLLRAREARLAKSRVRPGEPRPVCGCARTGAETSLRSGFLISSSDKENTAVQRCSSLSPVLPQNLGELVDKGAASQQDLAIPESSTPPRPSSSRRVGPEPGAQVAAWSGHGHSARSQVPWRHTERVRRQVTD